MLNLWHQPTKASTLHLQYDTVRHIDRESGECESKHSRRGDTGVRRTASRQKVPAAKRPSFGKMTGDPAASGARRPVNGAQKQSQLNKQVERTFHALLCSPSDTTSTSQALKSGDFEPGQCKRKETRRDPTGGAPAMRPCTWNSGMTSSERSLGVSS